MLVTDPWHALRSLRMATDAGIDAVSSPTRSGPSVRTRGVQVRYIARETAAYLYYRVFGRSSDGGPARGLAENRLTAVRGAALACAAQPSRAAGGEGVGHGRRPACAPTPPRAA